ncbi:MAG: FG-GAP repeat protein [Planctomycetes bacterium]|nr:FG-GAP repeat protein [Planctomycetota bacterium]
MCRSACIAASFVFALSTVEVFASDVSPQWSTSLAGTQLGAAFGDVVATAGDVNGDGYSDTIVGAPTYDGSIVDQGAAFVFLGSANGLATTPAWSVFGTQPAESLGVSVATAGDVNADGYSDVVVGSLLFNNGQTSEGAAFVYLGSAAGLALTPAWAVEGNQAGALFGSSVAFAGDVNADGYSDVIVGAMNASFGQVAEGRVSLFRGSSSGLATSAAWTLESNQALAAFGASVSTAGDVNGDGFADLVIGAPGFDDGESDEGQAYVFLGSASVSSPAAQWTKQSNQSDALYGSSVSTAGDTDGDGFADVIIGAPAFDFVHIDEGLAFLHRGSAAGVVPSSTWSGRANQASAFYGTSVATAGDVNGDGHGDVVIGAPQFGQGRVFVHRGSTQGLSNTATWNSAPISGASHRVGECVATAGDVDGDGLSDVVVGAPLGGTGSAYAFHGFALDPVVGATWGASGASAGSSHGAAVASAGDVNADGCSDLLVGAPTTTSQANEEGLVVLSYGSPGSTAYFAAWQALGGQVSAHFGASVAGIGDVNGDGYDDVAIGAPGYVNGPGEEGAVFVHLGGATGLGISPAWVAFGSQAQGLFGASVAAAGDVNGDGFADLVVGAPNFDLGEVGEGAAFVYLGSEFGLGFDPARVFDADQAFASFGFHVAGAGDVDGDGFSDVIVGAPLFDSGQLDEGVAFVHRGGLGGSSASAGIVLECDRVGARFGGAVTGAGDVDGDGFCDVVVGADQDSNGEANEGRAYAYSGGSAGPNSTATWIAESNGIGANFGASVASADDTDGDGISDVVVGAPRFAVAGISRGAAFLYRGSMTGLGTVVAWNIVGDDANANFGAAVASSGDLDGDGDPELVVGAPQQRFIGVELGAFHQFVGNGGNGTGQTQRQARPDTLAPIALRGAMPATTFVARRRVKTPFGRADARLQIEAKPRTTAFDGRGLSSSAKVDSGAAGLDVALSVTIPAAATPVHWRSRVEHDGVTTPFLPAGRWRSFGSIAVTEAQLRTSTCGTQTATASKFGNGKAGTSGVPVLETFGTPRLGKQLVLGITNATPSAGPVVVFAGAQSATIPFDGGTLLVMPILTLVLPAIGPTGVLLLPIGLPADPALCGIELVLQAGYVDAGATGFYHLALTNGAQWTLGN